DAERRPVGIACAQHDLVGRNPEDLANDVGEHGLVALPRRPRQRVEPYVATGVEADGDLLLADAARGLDEHRAADAAQLVARFRLGAAGFAAPPFSSLQP